MPKLKLYTTTNEFDKKTDSFEDDCLTGKADGTVEEHKRNFDIAIRTNADEKTAIDDEAPEHIYPADSKEGTIVEELRKIAQITIEEAELEDNYTVCVNRSEPNGKTWDGKVKTFFAHFLYDDKVARVPGNTANKYEEISWYVKY